MRIIEFTVLLVLVLGTIWFIMFLAKRLSRSERARELQIEISQWEKVKEVAKSPEEKEVADKHINEIKEIISNLKKGEYDG